MGAGAERQAGIEAHDRGIAGLCSIRAARGSTARSRCARRSASAGTGRARRVPSPGPRPSRSAPASSRCRDRRLPARPAATMRRCRHRTARSGSSPRHSGISPTPGSKIACSSAASRCASCRVTAARRRPRARARRAVAGLRCREWRVAGRACAKYWALRPSREWPFQDSSRSCALRETIHACRRCSRRTPPRVVDAEQQGQADQQQVPAAIDEDGQVGSAPTTMPAPGRRSRPAS